IATTCGACAINGGAATRTVRRCSAHRPGVGDGVASDTATVSGNTRKGVGHDAAAYRGTVRIGVLGAARIVKTALLVPSHAIEGVEVTAIAARDRDRAAAYASRRGIPRMPASYQG